jgi:hypothetical protein
MSDCNEDLSATSKGCASAQAIYKGDHKLKLLIVSDLS